MHFLTTRKDGISKDNFRSDFLCSCGQGPKFCWSDPLSYNIQRKYSVKSFSKCIDFGLEPVLNENFGEQLKILIYVIFGHKNLFSIFLQLYFNSFLFVDNGGEIET